MAVMRQSGSFASRPPLSPGPISAPTPRPLGTPSPAVRKGAPVSSLSPKRREKDGRRGLLTVRRDQESGKGGDAVKTQKPPRTQGHTGTVTEETETGPQVETGKVVAAEMWLSPTTGWRVAEGGGGGTEGCREGEGWLAQGSKLKD